MAAYGRPIVTHFGSEPLYVPFFVEAGMEMTITGLARYRSLDRSPGRTSWAIFALVIQLWVPAHAQEGRRVETVSFPSNVVQSTKAAKRVQLESRLFLPGRTDGPVSAVVLIPSSGGVNLQIEIHYANALANSGIAALVVDSFASRKLKNSITDQSVLTPFEMVNDAFGALRWLSNDKRFRSDKIGISGVSKGGEAAINTALLIQRKWASIPRGQKFAAHAPVVPPCFWLNSNLATTGSPMHMFLAELDDWAPAAQCVSLSKTMSEKFGASVSTTVYPNVHHAWEVVGAKPYYDAKAENYSKCLAHVTDSGKSVSKDGTEIPSNNIFGWARKNCMTYGTHCCGGTIEQKEAATADLIAFFKRNGF